MIVLEGPINNIVALVQIMAWRRPGDKLLFDPNMFRFPTHTYVSRPQWVKMTEAAVLTLIFSIDEFYDVFYTSMKHSASRNSSFGSGHENSMLSSLSGATKW